MEMSRVFGFSLVSLGVGDLLTSTSTHTIEGDSTDPPPISTFAQRDDSFGRVQLQAFNWRFLSDCNGIAKRVVYREIRKFSEDDLQTKGNIQLLRDWIKGNSLDI